MNGSLPLRLSRASGVPFYRQIEDQISELIRSGHLGPGDALPSVRALAESTLVSLITIRKAYADLEHAGLVELRQGQGTFVANEVAKASRRRARADAKEALQEAVARARQLGLTDQEQWKILEELLGSRGNGDG